MIDPMEAVGAVSVLGLVGVCIKLSINKKKNGNYVEKETCIMIMKSSDQRINDLKNHIDNRFDDLKSLIQEK